MPHDYRSKITPQVSTMLLQLMHLCYKQGVSDAADLHDNNRCREFVEIMKNGHRFGLVDKDYFIDWIEWRSLVNLWSSRVRNRRMANSYLSGIEVYCHYDSVPLRLCMDWYVVGVEDYTKFPETAGLPPFLYNNDFGRWRRKWEREPKRSLHQFNDEVVLLLNERRRKDAQIRDEEGEDKRFTLNKGAYELFLKTVMFVRYELVKRKKGKKKVVKRR